MHFRISGPLERLFKRFSLFVTLHNNAIQKLYTDNTVGEFAVDLVQSIELGPIEK